MAKRILTLVLAVAMLTATFVPLALAEDNSPSPGMGDYYVYTENGKGLNVRAMPRGTVVGSLKYGSKVHVDAFVDDNWALITYRYDNGYGMGDYAAYVNRRFLVKNKPAARKNNSSSSSSKTSTGLNTINDVFKTAKNVETPYEVTVRPARVSGWVNMRWAPSTDAELIATYKSNAKLLVIKEFNGWVQVEDQDTGNVGFMSSNYVVK